MKALLIVIHKDAEHKGTTEQTNNYSPQPTIVVIKVVTSQPS